MIVSRFESIRKVLSVTAKHLYSSVSSTLGLRWTTSCYANSTCVRSKAIAFVKFQPRACLLSPEIPPCPPINKSLSPYSSPHPPLSPVKKRPRPYSSPLKGEKQRGGGRKNDEAFYLREKQRGGGRISSKSPFLTLMQGGSTFP